MARLHWAGIWVWDDGQAGPCMGGAWHRCMVPVHGAGWVGGGVVYFLLCLVTCDVINVTSFVFYVT